MRLLALIQQALKALERVIQSDPILNFGMGCIESPDPAKPDFS
jgi:hypothetical protein